MSGNLSLSALQGQFGNMRERCAIDCTNIPISQSVRSTEPVAIDCTKRSSPEFAKPIAVSAIDCTSKFMDVSHISEEVSSLLRDSLSDNSRRAYNSDIQRFEAWGGSLPTTPEHIAIYLSEHAETHAVATLRRWLASLAKAHRGLGAPDPTKNELIKSLMLGIRRRRGSAQDQAKPLMRDDLFEMLDQIGEGTKADRDRAILLIGFAGGFRRSELVGLDCDDLEHVKQGAILTVRRSKTDQIGQGRKIGIPWGRGRHCPVEAIDTWLQRLASDHGPLFRPIDRHGNIADSRLSGEAISLLVRTRLVDAHIDPTGYSGHSLRAGFATSAAQAGVSYWKIRQQTGHASDAMLGRYIRDGELFVNNGAGPLL